MLLRRVLKMLLKKSLSHLLATEVDLSQLNVQLGSWTCPTAKLELKDCLLDTDCINQSLVSCASP
jgi:hypothetical protein